MFSFGIKKKRRIYLDYAAATPLDRRVLAAMQPWLVDGYGNASAIHAEGVAARQAVEQARLSVGRTLRVRPSDVTFTSGGTESNNLAIYGWLRQLKEETGREFSDCEIITTNTEHPSIVEPLKHIESYGVTVHWCPVTESGELDEVAFKSLLSNKTVLVTVAYANSETGVVQPLSRLHRVIEAKAKEFNTQIVFHTDASQAPLWLPCDLERLGVDMMTLDASKYCGPKGSGLLIHRPRVQLQPVLRGGGQEAGLRPGTEPVAHIVGNATALQIAAAESESRRVAVTKLRDYLIDKLLTVPTVVLNGSHKERLANNVNISIPGVDTEYAVVVLDKHGVAASTKSACSGAGGGESTVVKAMTDDAARAASTIRFSLSPDTTQSELDRVVAVLRDHLDQMQPYRRS